KTFQAILASAHLPRVLVVVPGYLKDNWADEIHKWLPEAPVTIVKGTRRQREALIHSYQRGYLIMHYEMIQGRAGYLPYLDGLDFQGLIFDEAHRLKDRRSQQARGYHFL